MAAETTIGQAATANDFATAEQILADAFQAASTSIALGLSSVLQA